MTRTSSIDRADYDKWSGVKCEALRRSQPWMHGDIRRPLKITGGKRADMKVPAADRKVYEACAAALMDRRLFSFVIDWKTGNFLVQWTEGADWVPMMRHEVAEQLGVTAAKAPKVAAKAPVSAPAVSVVEVAPATVAEIEEAMAPAHGSAWPESVVEYLARLVFEPKRQYATELAAHLLDGADAPADPGTEWAVKVRTKFERFVVSV